MNESKMPVPPINRLFERLNVLHGLLKHLENHLKIFQSSVKRLAEQNDIGIDKLFAGFALGIRDLTLRPGEGYIYGYYPTGKFVTEGEEYIEVADLLIVREAAWTISQAFEAFETYLRDSYAHYLWNHKNAAEDKELERKREILLKKKLKPEQAEYWQTFVRLARYDNIKILQLIRGQFPDLEMIERNNSYDIDLTEWFSVATEVRHSVTHSNMLIKAEIVKTWDTAKTTISKDYFLAETRFNGYEIKPNVEQAEMNLRLFAGYAYVLHKLFNGLHGTISEILGND